MVPASVVAAFLALVLLIGSVLFSWVPLVGPVISFSAPLTALVGLVLGGLAMSRAQRAGEPAGAAVVALVMNGIVLLPSLLVALTCGLCSACVTAAAMKGGAMGPGPLAPDAGVVSAPSAGASPPPSAPAASPPPPLGAPPSGSPAPAVEPPPGAPPPALPPPPLPPALGNPPPAPPP